MTAGTSSDTPTLPAVTLSDAGSHPGVAIVVPIKGFEQAKQRLAGRLDPRQRRDLAEAMASTVLDAAAAGSLHTIVVTDDETVAAWAERRGARTCRPSASGLDLAVTEGVARAMELGFRRVVVSHADLPYARSFAAVIEATESIVIVPDRHLDGTNVIALDAGSGFVFRYGPGSFERHRQEARRLTLSLGVLEDPSLSWDVDEAADLPRWTVWR